MTTTVASRTLPDCMTRSSLVVHHDWMICTGVNYMTDHVFRPPASGEAA
jgi:hypothetical protein